MDDRIWFLQPCRSPDMPQMIRRYVLGRQQGTQKPGKPKQQLCRKFLAAGFFVHIPKLCAGMEGETVQQEEANPETLWRTRYVHKAPDGQFQMQGDNMIQSPHCSSGSKEGTPDFLVLGGGGGGLVSRLVGRGGATYNNANIEKRQLDSYVKCNSSDTENGKCGSYNNLFQSRTSDII